MTEVSGAGSADTQGVDGADAVDQSDSISAVDAAVVADDAVGTGEAAASAVANEISESTDTFEAEAEQAEPSEPTEDPSLLESAATWAGQTAKGYATGAINGVLDMANVVNMGANAALDAVGVDYEFATDMEIAPTSETERHAQNAITIASMAAGGYGLVKSAPAIGRAVAKGIDDLTAPAAGVASGTTAAARLGDLSPTEIARIQAAADELGADIYVVGSAAKGTRRNVDTDLPLADFGGSKAGTKSDIDYVVANRSGLDDAADALDLPDNDPSFGVRGLDYITLDSSPAIRFSPGRTPEVLEGTGRLPLVD